MSARPDKPRLGPGHVTPNQQPSFREFHPPADAADIRDLAFSEGEYRRRLRATQQAIASHDLDALVCTFLPNICYLSGYETLASFAPAFLVVTSDADPTLLVDEFEAFNTLVWCWVEEVATFPWAGDPVAALIELVRQRGWAQKRVGSEHHQRGGGYQAFVRAQAALAADWIYAHDIVERVRAVKSAAEIDALCEAARLTALGFEAAADVLAYGALDTEIASAAYGAIVGSGSERMSIQPIVTFGRNSGVPHTTFRRRRLAGGGDAVLMEWGACVKRYTAPMIRTGFVADAADVIWRTMYDACVEAVEGTIDQIRPGASTLDIAERASAPLFELPDQVFADGNRGYSVGLSFEPDWSDVPGLQIATGHWRITRSVETYPQLQPGHVFHVRAVARDVARAGVGVSETVLVTDAGCEVLTTRDRELIIAR